ncbi:hypothetical protein F8388_002899 [Cannabis sativa]|uniref:non-specific serine/threonine protein kinase n=1 Tax=Cannabis sativa TaxID=3483 RepID=A0A7J6E2M6_CANSA|nr:hypothetical protein F8388_002899 [Cannabis sativa]
MGNCCATPGTPSQNNRKNKKKSNPFSGDYPVTNVMELGRGEFGVTYLCTELSTGDKFACKSISKKKLKTAVDIEDVRREVEIMKHLRNHPNIVTLKDSYEDDNAVHIVMELCEGGELFDRIVARGHYTERAAAAVMRTIELFVCKQERNIPLKAIDFGLSMFFKPGERFNEIVGSPYYMAPEVLKRNYGPEVDVWSAGVIRYILLCGVPPFWAEGSGPRVSDNAKDLVKKMLDPDPKQRLTAQEVLEHPWIQNAKKAPNVPLGETVRARLKQFSVMNKLKKRALGVIAEHLSIEEVAGIKEAFEMMDNGNKGKVVLEELRIGLQKLGQQIPEPDLQILMEAADVDGDGALNYGEFVAVSVHLRRMANDEHLHKAFSFFDQNGSGYIEIEELRNALNDEVDTNSEEVITAIMHDVDTDKDGRISYEEFAAMMKAGTDWRKASRQYSRERFNSLSLKLMREGSLQLTNEGK